LVLPHWLLLVQVVRQVAPEQPKPLQEVIVAAAQVPLPSQLRAEVTTPSVQLAAPQLTEVDANTQDVLVPVQALPQVPLAQGVRAPRGACPAASSAQWPRDPARSQAWHEPAQAASQQ
jgi:hypothetical protein